MTHFKALERTVILNTTNNTVNPVLTPSNKLKGGKIGDYPASYSLVNLDYLQYQNKALMHFGFNYPTFRDLVTIYMHYNGLSIGIAVSGIVNTFGKSAGSYRALGWRLSLLQHKGLIKCVNRLYYPTELCLEEFSKLML